MGRKALGALEITKSNTAILILNCSGQKKSTLGFQALLFFMITPFSPTMSPLNAKLLSLSSAAKSKPIIAEPEIHGGHSLDGVTGILGAHVRRALQSTRGSSWAWAGQPGEPAHKGNVPVAIDSLQRCQLLSYRLNSSSVLSVLARLNACATPFQSNNMGAALPSQFF